MDTAQLMRIIREDNVAEVRRALALWPGLVETATPAGEPLSHWAAREGSLAMLRLLVEYGTKVNLNAVDESGRDMLHYAAESGNVEKCRYLVERGGMDPLRGDLELITPYDQAHQGGWKQLEAYFAAVVGAPWEAMYRNPIRSGMYPDPSICRVGEDYYMVNSTFVYFPCIPVSHSRDLVHWEVIGHAITRPEWANLEGLEGGRGYWAPDISYAEGRFYICATLRLNDGGEVCRRQMVVTAQRPEGPYSEPVFFEEDGIDPSLFHDTDGRHYMLLNRGARIFEVDAQATRRLSETTLLYYGSCKRAPEGPHLLKKDGWYYLFLAEGGTGMGHRETVARSRNLHGPYEPSPYGPVLRQWDERALIQRCGHAKPVSTPDGRWYLVYLCGRALEGQWTLLGRETALDPIQWTADGWPLLNHGRGPSVLQRKPLPDAPVHGSVDWLTPRPPQPGTVHWCGERLILRAGDSDLTEVSCRSLQVRRQTAFRCSFAATVTVPRRGEAGIVCYYDEHSFLALGIRHRENGMRLWQREQIGLECREQDLGPCPVQAGQGLWLGVKCDGLTRRLYAGEGDTPVSLVERATYLSDEGVSLGKRFTGAMIGMYAVRQAEAQFADITYTEG